MFEDFEHVISYWNVREKTTLVKYSNEIELIFVELPKFTKTEQELDSITEKWIYFIKHAGELDFVPTSFTEPHLVEAFDMAKTAGLTEEELDLQLKRRDFIYFQKGAVEKAKHDGEQSATRTIARKLLATVTGSKERNRFTAGITV
jgi:predicted transposase/invertase (TIGR01784 family)